MKLLRNGSRRDSGTTQLFDKSPAIKWDAKSKQIALTVPYVRDVSVRNSYYDYQLLLTVDDLQKMIGSLAKE
jgi:hypothetical protein